jgi:DNA-nicking Smr family endonuclease
MAARARALTETEAAEWASFARRIVPLSGRRGFPSSTDVAASTDVSASADVSAAVDVPEPRARVPGASGAVASSRPVPLGIGGQPAGVDTSTWQRFYRGQLSGGRKLDLHGMTAQHAFAELRVFLRTAHADRVRCVEIVTGRGKEGSGVLRRELPLWLNLPDIRPMVLAATHPHASNAMHSHAANPGSVRLLLRRART